MDVGIRRVGEVTILDLAGKLKFRHGDDLLRNSVDRLLCRRQPLILLNLEQISSVDSAGLGELVACYKRTLKHNGMLKVVNPPACVSELLRITKLDHLFGQCYDEEAALEALWRSRAALV